MTARSNKRFDTQKSINRMSSFDSWSAKMDTLAQEKKIEEDARQGANKLKEQAAKIENDRTSKLVSEKVAQKVVKDQALIKRIFDLFDVDQSGSLSPSEFPPVLAMLLQIPEQEIDNNEVWKNWDEIDEDGSGSVTFEEFQAWYSKVFNVEINPDRTDFITIDIVPADQRMLREVSKKLSLDNLKVESLWKEFKKLDQDSSGSLDQEEFKVIVQQILSPTNPRADKVEVPEKVMHKFWIEVDTDNSGSVNFEEFAAWYMKCFDGSASPMEQYYSKLGSNFRTTVVERTVTNMALESGPTASLR